MAPDSWDKILPMPEPCDTQQEQVADADVSETNDDYVCSASINLFEAPNVLSALPNIFAPRSITK